MKDLLNWVEHIKKDKKHKVKRFLCSLLNMLDCDYQKKLKQTWFLKWVDFGG